MLFLVVLEFAAKAETFWLSADTTAVLPIAILAVVPTSKPTISNKFSGIVFQKSWLVIILSLIELR
ncbi:hypothetical protein EQG49_06715 [Periweissella cryptocerci]|uniref:Uncharacterized protein n=1 Tax=Periweissella cryptocerci TaxID=2506420 RepID=A0A4P6YU03_9LACO|nr:hypothetical protein [Periweissella cryptocerci]QBO36173.1 hypothetical protein EQG49_06715 [Periweissella cryptocerci]